MSSSTSSSFTTSHSTSQTTQHLPPSQTTASYLSYPVSHVVSGLYRRLTEPTTTPLPRSSSQTPSAYSSSLSTMNGVYTPPQRTASPFQPPPLSALSLRGIRASSSVSAQILTRSLAEEIRLLFPPRLQLVADWTLAYSVEQDGTSLGTLYTNCTAYTGKHRGFVLAIRDGAGGTFGAFLTDPPAPSPAFYGTGETFLWRASILPPASILASLPPPPSADTTNLQRSTTIASSSFSATRSAPRHQLLPHGLRASASNTSLNNNNNAPGSGYSTPDRIRFKAFPYSGVNDYVIFCQPDYLSVGGGDGRYGLWLDSVLERGVSSACLTFGNEALSEEGEKFEVVGVEVWYVGV